VFSYNLPLQTASGTVKRNTCARVTSRLHARGQHHVHMRVGDITPCTVAALPVSRLSICNGSSRISSKHCDNGSISANVHQWHKRQHAKNGPRSGSFIHSIIHSFVRRYPSDVLVLRCYGWESFWSIDLLDESSNSCSGDSRTTVIRFTSTSSLELVS
jgi:hypothetical protein